MSLKQTIADDLKAAMKIRAKERVEVLRMARAKMMEAEVALRASMGRDYELSDDEASKALAAYAKQRRDSIESFRRAGREDLAAREEAELAIVQEYLPRRLSDGEVRVIVREVIAEVGADSPRQMGAVMKAVLPRVQGVADGKLVSRIVSELLSGRE
ncbi:MAG TPA: GatB/YqeY domain-containing protein [Candidatus Polarisedimenticolia bacterium]|nr:GatB/YqeY domain-containing protein [Candidatus Polarisedimenticolia bacterium]